jgi:hypothetical protein
MFDSHIGEFPFLQAKPSVYGAHWLPAMLMGTDHLGYVNRNTLPRSSELRGQPWCWYAKPGDSGCTLDNVLERRRLYLDPNGIRLKATKDLPGRENRRFFEDWDDMKDLPVLADSFDQPILYYVANAHGRATNMVADEHLEDNDYSGSGPQDEGVPYYFHQDNIGFTGITDDPESEDRGWDFGSRDKTHAIAVSGADLSGPEIAKQENRWTFARYVLDRQLFTLAATSDNERTPLRPVNADSYLLISAGPDGRYGTNDDVSNLPPWPE